MPCSGSTRRRRLEPTGPGPVRQRLVHWNRYGADHSRGNEVAVGLLRSVGEQPAKLSDGKKIQRLEPPPGRKQNPVADLHRSQAQPPAADFAGAEKVLSDFRAQPEYRRHPYRAER